MGGMEALAAAEKAFSEGGVSFESEGMEQVMFAEQGNERLGAFESALLAEARARPDACGRALDKATALVGTAHRAEVAGGGSQVGELFVEDALAKSLARFENSLLIRARTLVIRRLSPPAARLPPGRPNRLRRIRQGKRLYCEPIAGGGDQLPSAGVLRCDFSPATPL